MPGRTEALASRDHTGEPDSVDALIDGVIAGTDDAWPALVRRVHPMVVAACARRRAFGGVDADEAGLDVAQRVVDKLHANDFARLRRYAETRRAYPDTSFRSWLGVVTGNAYVDYLRGLPDLQRKRVDQGLRLVPVPTESLDEGGVGAAVDMARALDIKRIVDSVTAESFPRDQRRALALWLVGCDAGEIADELGLGERGGASRLLRAARQRLRRLVRKEQG